MRALATITDETAVRIFRRVAIILLTVSVFSLGLHAKLALYKPVPPSMLVTLTKLALNEHADGTPSPLGKQASPDIVGKLSWSLAFAFCSLSIPAQAQREAKSTDALCAALHHLNPLLLHKPPPPASRLIMHS